METLFDIVFRIGNYSLGLNNFNTLGFLWIIAVCTGVLKFLHSLGSDYEIFKSKNRFFLWISAIFRFLQFQILPWFYLMSMFLVSKTIFLTIGIIFILERTISLIMIFNRSDFSEYSYSYNKIIANFYNDLAEKIVNSNIYRSYRYWFSICYTFYGNDVRIYCS